VKTIPCLPKGEFPCQASSLFYIYIVPFIQGGISGVCVVVGIVCFGYYFVVFADHLPCPKINRAAPPTLHEIALTIGLNTNKLKRGFKQVFGTTVFGLIRNIRLEEARVLLQEGNFSVTEVALQVGYNSLSHFARLFKQTYGLYPHAFMKQISF